VLRDAAPGLPDDARAVGVVDDERRAVLARQLDELGELREVALHREDAVGEDERALPGLERLELGAQVVHVGVLEDRLPRGFASRTASMIDAWFSSSERITVRSSVSEGMHASFAFQHET
jgi:hypothetical protein